MPLQIPSRSEVVASLQAFTRTNIPDLDPTVTRRRGFIGGMVKSLGSALHDWYVRLKRYADREPFPQTATGDFLLNGWWADITKLTRNPTAPARGKIVITGSAGTILSAGAQVTGNNRTYTVDNSVAVVAQTLNISSLTRDGTTAIAETTSDHYLATGQEVTISGATQSAYNITATITVTAANEFTYEVSGSPATPATGSPVLSGTWGNADVTCTENGQNTNIDGGSSVTVSSPPAGLDATALVTFGGIAGGTDLEDIEAYRERILEALGTDFGMFSAAEIKIVAKTVPGVTRVWVTEATEDGSNGVYPGQVKIWFMRDGDANPFPSATEVAAVKSRIVDNILPAHTAEEDVIVSAPTELSVGVTFSALSPDTASMRRAIQASLSQFFAEAVDLGEDITADAYRCAIKDAYDSERGQALKSFSLSTPSGDVSVGNDELPTLGTITYP